MGKWHHRIHTNTRTPRRCVVHINCLTVWSNSKWICDLSIDSFSPRLWIKCFNYWCADVRCPLECCMWCRPLSPGELLPSPLPTLNLPCTPTDTAASPPLPPADALLLPPPLFAAPTWYECNFNSWRCRQLADRHQPIGSRLIQRLSLFLCSCSPPWHLLQPSPPEAFLCHRSSATFWSNWYVL